MQLKNIEFEIIKHCDNQHTADFLFFFVKHSKQKLTCIKMTFMSVNVEIQTVT